MRAVIGAAGVSAGAFGAWLLLSRQDADQIWNAAIWLATGVALHDGLLAAVTLLLGALLLRITPTAARAPAVVGFVVLGPLTLIAVPVLGRFGARPDNPTLLDRQYVVGWCVLALLTLAVVIASALLRAWLTRRR